MTFTAPLTRIGQPGVAGEREALAAGLDYHRATLVTKLDGLDDEQLRRRMTPTRLSPLGLVKQLRGVEHWWFAIQFARADEEFLQEHVAPAERLELRRDALDAAQPGRDRPQRAALTGERQVPAQRGPVHRLQLRFQLL